MDFNKVSSRLLSGVLCLTCTVVASDSLSATSTSTATSSTVSMLTNPTPVPYFTDSALSLPLGSREYSFDFPAYRDSSEHVILNYKDTLELVWTDFPPNNPPTLQIHCWNRTNPPNSYPLWAAQVFDFTQNITTFRNLNLTGDNSTYLTVPLEPYRPYNPCQFALVDSVNASLSRGLCVSSDFVILEDEAAPMRIWNNTFTLPSTTTSIWTAENASSPDWWTEFGGDPPTTSNGIMRSGGWGFSIFTGSIMAFFLL